MATCPKTPTQRPPGALLGLVLYAAGLASCSTSKPPAPPAVDESSRRPANDVQSLEMIRLQGQVRNLELQVHAQAQQRSSAVLLAAAATQREAAQRTEARPPPAANQVFVVPFGFGQTQIKLGSTELSQLVEAAKGSAYIVVRGRTDGSADSLSEARIARERAAGMKAFLAGFGIDASKIRMTYQPIGDHLSDNAAQAGRDLNRRVEVELYAVKPAVALLGAPSTHPQ